MHLREVFCLQKNYDVVIIGLGTAGSIAAIKCAKLGLSVLGVERLTQMGGTGTSGGICGYYYGSSGGYYEEINKKASDIQNEYFIDAPYTLSEPKGIALEREALSSGVEISYNTHCISVKKDGNKVVSATFIKNGEKFEVFSKLFMDTSGNGDFSYLCGCEFMGGRDSDNAYMPYTNPLFVANPTPRVLNRDSGLIDMADNTAYSKELVHSASLYPFEWKIMEKDATFLKLAPLPGIRESRRVVTEKVVTFEEAISREKFEDTIFYAFSNADTHEKCIALEPDTAKDWYVACNLWGVCMSVAVPMRALIPEKIDSLLCGGRILGVTHTLSSVVRMKKDMEKCGEAMAYMAFIAISKNIEIRNVSYSDLLPFLLKSGVLDEKNDVGFLNRTKDGLSPFEFSTTIKELDEDLSSERETFGIFSAKQIENSAEYLTKMQNSTDRKGKLCAIALGRMGDERAIPVLREIAKNRDMTLPHALKMTVPFSISAIYLLGKLKDRQSVPILKDIISDNGSFDESLYVSNEMFPEKEDLRFQFVSHSVSSLKEIALFADDLKDDILNFLKKELVLSDRSFVLNIKAGHKLKPVPFDYGKVIKNFILS